MGRTVIIVLAVAGLLPLLGDPKALNATTVSGTIVLGLGPPVFALIFVDGYRPLTFHLPFWWCALDPMPLDYCCHSHFNTGMHVDHAGSKMHMQCISSNLEI